MRGDFVARQAYRQDLRAALAEAQLDDAHDQVGQSLYRLQFDATVTPGRDKNRYAVTQLEIRQPEVEVMDYFPEVYRTWLGHATNRLNRSESSGEWGADGVYRGLAAAGAFSLNRVYYNPGYRKSWPYDRCDRVRTPRQAELEGCKNFALAVPPRRSRPAGSRWAESGASCPTSCSARRCGALSSRLVDA